MTLKYNFGICPTIDFQVTLAVETQNTTNHLGTVYYILPVLGKENWSINSFGEINFLRPH